MRPTRHILRDDDRFVVTVGWDPGSESFYAQVRDAADSEVVLNVGVTPHELPTISSLVAAVSRFAPLQPELISALRHEATPLDAAVSPLTSFG